MYITFSIMECILACNMRLIAALCPVCHYKLLVRMCPNNPPPPNDFADTKDELLFHPNCSCTSCPYSSSIRPQIGSACLISILPRGCRLVDFVMGLKKLRSLTITLEQDCRETDSSGDLCKLQKHPALQEIRLLLSAKIEGFWAFGEEASVPVARGLCSFYASQQLKVLHLIVSKARAKVNIQRFHSVLFCCNIMQKAETSQYRAAHYFCSPRNDAS